MEPDIRLIENFVQDADSLFVQIRDGVDWDERMRARKTASFGVSYDYSGMTYPQIPMPDYLAEICRKIEESIGFLPNNCLMNYYPDGKSSMGFHSDSSEELAEGTGVVILSLGSVRHITYRLIENKELKVKYALQPGALLHMDNEIQTKWQHAIPKEKGAGERISLTFRHIMKS